ncbi:trk system potassium uptake protein TrkH [Natronospira proteinivora]|uniref:Trk system potassium uptake protein n=1 Tax=Natronospira proteinivora TaxID=1807133 RepID=A0ABT1GDD5_9GAMM|nr:TrkH family potassium uptake protein [Natronospira proteinivora]MCP1728273.1 trk system potassium uptake protein TrkH [Natronospira proteinivora]
MHVKVIQRILGLLLMAFSLSMLPPIGVSFWYADGSHMAFISGFAIVAGLGFLMWLPARKEYRDMRARDGFVVVAGFWTVLGLAGAVPLMLSENPNISFTDAAFEAVSGLTTTGSTILVGLEELPKSILYYRQQLQWLGGMGIIVLAIAVLPMLGVGGMQLFRAEITGPMKETRITPRIAETAKGLWYIYLGLTAACAFAYWLAGMTPFDAIGHAYSTVGIGGFSTYDGSLGYFDNHVIEMVAVAFMFIAGVNFALHFLAVRRQMVGHYFQDPEFKTYLLVQVVIIVGVVSYLLLTRVYESGLDALVKGAFQAVSISTTTGFTSADYAGWPGFLPVLLIFSSFIGACAASTSGGMKVIRMRLLASQGAREINRLVHPNAEIPAKLGKRIVPQRVLDSVWAFFSVYVALFVVMMLILMASGHDQVTAFSAVAAALNNLGPGLGEVSANFTVLDDVSKWVLVAAMLMGRLEIFTVLVLLTPAFWRR